MRAAHRPTPLSGACQRERRRSAWSWISKKATNPVENTGGTLRGNSWTQESREAYEVKPRLLRRGRPANRASSGRTEAPAVAGKAHANNQHPFSGSRPALLHSSAARLGAGFLSGSAWSRCCWSGTPPRAKLNSSSALRRRSPARWPRTCCGRWGSSSPRPWIN